MLNETNLHPYQRRAIEFIRHNPRAALWIDMGLGKTVTTLTALVDLLRDGRVRQVLVIAPLRVAQHTWPAEVREWEHLQGLEITVAAGLSPKARQEAVESGAPITVINREQIPWLVDHFGQAWPFDAVVIDESSSFKSHASKRWKALRKVLGKIERMVQLTGTPAPNSLLELWPQVYLLDGGKRLENTRGKFLEKYCRQVGNPSWAQWEVRGDRVEAIYKKVADVVLRMSAEDYLKMPKRIDSTVRVTLPPKARKAYEQMEKEFLLRVDRGEVLAANAAVQINKLLQVSNGAVYDAEKEWHELHTAKLDALDEIIESANEPILLAYHYKSDLERLLDRYPQAEVLGTDPQTIESWNDGMISLLLAHPASAGHGLNLQRGGSVIVWFGLSWSLELYEQFCARLHRQGQKKPVRVYHILADTGADHAVYDVLKNKQETQSSLLRFVAKLRDDRGTSKV